MIIIRRGQKLLTIIECSIFRCLYTTSLEIVSGQPPLPWELEKKEDPAVVGRREKEERRKGKEQIGLEGKDRSKPEGMEMAEVYSGTLEHAILCDAARAVWARGETRKRMDGLVNRDKTGHMHGPDRRLGQQSRDARHMASNLRDKETTSDWRAKPSPRDRQLPVVTNQGKGFSSQETQVSRNDETQVVPPCRQVASTEIPPRSDDQINPTNLIYVNQLSSDTSIIKPANETSNVNSNEDLNETNADPIPIYSNSDNQEEDDLDDETTERLEKEIEKEFDDMWLARLEWQESQVIGEAYVEPIQMDPANQPLQTTPYEPCEGITLTPQEPPDEADGGNLDPAEEREEAEAPPISHKEKAQEKSGNQPEDGISNILGTPNAQLLLKGKEAFNPGPEPNLDISRHTWKPFRGSWILISEEAWEALAAETDTREHTTQEAGRSEEQHTKEKKGKQKKSNPDPPNDGIRRSGRVRKPLANQNGDSFDWLEVLMISSSNRTDLVFPKGGWENDETLREAACREALEEAGVRGIINETALGVWEFRSKRFQNNCSMEGSCRGYMFAMEVTEELDSWPEQDEHKRRWVTVMEALQLCRYEWMREALRACLRVLSVKPSLSIPMISEPSPIFHLMNSSNSEQMIVL
ncbi:hypothetical protein J5N97_016578 [Dioscorea zingiberensis]|uniref:Nudix hydrolase domain-containing protein n=1 Tax=Dioscorea zingiberensis TaxID=325984 RepID=A0A9D5HFS3_9LILI|nr:hypothetical protein J5N97_016578 [Dioscorea zingiberensis]